MDRRQQVFERCKGGSRSGSLLLRGGIDDDGWRFDNGRRSGLLGRLHLTSQFCDGLLEVGIVAREAQRRTVVHQRLFELALPSQRVGKAANGRQILRRRPQYLLEFGLCVRVLAKFEQRAAEGYSRREIRGMYEESGAADVHRFLKHAGSPVLFRELGKSNRRRVLLDPSSEIVET
jgi:hypothetical protein